MKVFLDMGKLPLANSLARTWEEDSPVYPLRIGFCVFCELVQLMDIVPPSLMFEQYAYQTSASRPMIDHFDEYAEWLVQLKKGERVMDIGSNDGTFLKSLRSRGVEAFGIEPAKNLADACEKEGLNVYQDFFGTDTFRKFGFPRPDVITANNVLTHVPDLQGFVKAVAELLKEGGSFVFEVPFFPSILEHNTFDMFYHEHISYFGLGPLMRMMRPYGLRLLTPFKYFPNIHGGTMRVVASKYPSWSAREERHKEFERERIINMPSLLAFADRVDHLRKVLKQLLVDLHGAGKTVSGYGAPAKATILLNYAGIGADLLSYASDTTPMKQGLYIPRVGIPIISPEKAPFTDYKLLLAWNYQEEILGKEKDYRAQGGKFIVPFPEPRIFP